ncbi:MAG: energy transducer TonB [bacterium]
MKKILVLVVMILFAMNLFAEQVEEMPKAKDYDALKSSVVYPEKAIKAGMEGKVIIAAWIDSTGKVTKTKIMESKNPIFDQATIDAVMKYDDYIPASIDKKTVGCWLQIPFEFKLPVNGSSDEKNRYIEINYDADELEQNILKVLKEYKYSNEVFVKTEVHVDKEGNITKILPIGTDDSLIDEIITKAIQNTKFTSAKYNGNNTDGFINLYIWLKLPKENFVFNFDGKPYSMNFTKDKNSNLWFADILIGTGKKIKVLDTIKFECIVYDIKQKQLNSEIFTIVYVNDETNAFINKYMINMKAGSERLLWLNNSSQYKKEFENYTKNLNFLNYDKVFLKIKVLDINPK